MRMYHGYAILWARLDYGSRLVEIDSTTVFLEIIALSASTGIIVLGKELWELWSRSKE